MKKKLIIFMPSIEGGGVEKNLFIVANYLVKKIKNISVITVSKKFKKKFNNSINFLSFKYNFWDTFPRRFKYFLSFFLLIKEIIKDKNLIVFAFQANIYCIIICKIFNVKVIVRSNSAPAGWSKNLIKKSIFKFFLKRADKVMANSYEFIKSLKKEFGVKAICIYNPLNKTEIIKKSNLKSKKYFKKKGLRILNIGRFTEQKNQITLLKSLNEIDKDINYEAIIAGKGKLKRNLKQYIDKNYLGDKIKIVNFLKNPYPLIKQCDLFILSSIYEGLPNVLLESLALRKFIISSDCPTGPKEILLSGRGGLLFKMNNHVDLKEKIIFYLNNPKKCKKMSNIAINNLNKFDYDKNLLKYYNLVNSVK